MRVETRYRRPMHTIVRRCLARPVLLLVGLALLSSACSSGGAAGAGKKTAGPKACPKAAALWPVIDWTDEVGQQLSTKLARDLLASPFFAKLRPGGQPRLRVFRVRNRTSRFVQSGGLTKQFEQALFASGKVVLITTGDRDASLELQLEETLEIRGPARISSVELSLEARAGAGAPFRHTSRVTRTLRPRPLPPGCAEPTWSCGGGPSQGRGEKGCEFEWTCANGRFAFHCAAPNGKQGDCQCKRSPTWRSTAPWLAGKKGRIEDVCASSGAAAATRAANKLCGFNLPLHP